ncbi:hypothetical protein [Bradyrhizobium japonicum]|uniref:hypothetical protein n=1 Tax=Bradyrhizobium japonicum TaxID=375 RepID=UPI0012FD16B0|nr:hypothetical protein [Bradyrhizobium japonicum]
MRSFNLREISCVDRPAQKGAMMTIIKHQSEDSVVQFTKAQAETAWSDALSAYAAKHNLSKSTAALEFSTTAEAQELYKRCVRASDVRREAIYRAASVANVSAEILAKSAFPGMSIPDAMVAWLGTDNGKEFYADSTAAKRAAEQGR